LTKDLLTYKPHIFENFAITKLSEREKIESYKYFANT